MDYGQKVTDKELAALEQRIEKVYSDASKDLKKTIDEYFAKFVERDKAQQKLLEDGKITDEQYKQWRLNQIGRGERFKDLQKRVAERCTKANETAVAYVNDETPGIYTLNRNYGAYEIESVAGDVGFTMWDESTVRRLAAEEPDIMPYYPQKRAVNRGIDLDYGKRQISVQVTSSILQGHSIGKIANNLQGKLVDMNRASAIRTARTAVTAAQNGGRQASYESAEKMGIEMEKEWIATLDNRTRHSHAVLDGERVAVDGKFSNGCRYPSDPQGKPWEVYNCRCTLVSTVKGIDTSGGLRRDKNGLLPNMTYAQWEASKRGAEAEPISAIRTKEISEWRKSLQNQENVAKLKMMIDRGTYSATIRVQQQNKHIEGTPQYKQYFESRINKGKTPQSVLTVSVEDAQKIITQYSCTGTVVFTKSGANTEKAIEYVTTDEVAGKFYMDDAFHETKRVAIYYAKKGSHVVPVKEEQNG